MELQRYVHILTSRKWVVILTTVVTLAVVALGSFSMTPIYSASALVRVTTGLGGSVTSTDLNYTERLIQTYVQLLKSRPFLEEVIGRLDLQVRPEAIIDTIKVEALISTELIQISVESTSPQQAAAIANTLGTLLVEQGQKMYYGAGKSARQILEEQVTVLEDQLRQDRARLASLSGATPGPDQKPESSLQDLSAKIHSEELTYATLLSQYDKARVDEAMRANSIGIVEPAIVPEISSKPNVKLNVVLGMLVGLMGGIGLAFLFENLSPLIHSIDDLKKTAGVPVLGRIPDFENRNNGNAQSPAAEAFRVLSASTLALMSEAHLKTILMTSAEPGAGKSTIVAHLAAAMAEAGRDVIVVDGDLRSPCLHQIFGVAREPGLSDLLLQPFNLELAVQATKVKRVRVVAAGSADLGSVDRQSLEFSNALVIAEVMSIMSQLAKDADIVLWDSPPVLAAADAALLAPIADGVVLVVERAQTQQETVRAACQQLIDVKANLIGMVVNRAKNDRRYNYYYQRPPKDSWWADTLKGIRRADSGHQGNEIHNAKKK